MLGLAFCTFSGKTTVFMKSYEKSSRKQPQTGTNAKAQRKFWILSTAGPMDFFKDLGRIQLRSANFGNCGVGSGGFFSHADVSDSVTTTISCMIWVIILRRKSFRPRRDTYSGLVATGTAVRMCITAAGFDP